MHGQIAGCQTDHVQVAKECTERAADPGNSLGVELLALGHHECVDVDDARRPHGAATCRQEFEQRHRAVRVESACPLRNAAMLPPMS
jgi:hypothetical protein